MKTYPLLTLIADDSEDDRVLFSRAVRSTAGLRLAAVTSDGVDTLAYLNGCAPYGNRMQFPFPDLILLDCQMPGYNGLEVMASLRSSQRRPKVVLWSSAIENIDERLAYDLGATIVCSKPVMVQELVKILKSMQPCNAHRANASVPAPPHAKCRFSNQSISGYFRNVLQPSAAQ